MWLTCGLLVAVLGSTASAGEFQQGVHGMSWGSLLSEHPQLRTIRKSASVTYCVNSSMVYQIGSQPVPGVVYGFWGTFFAAYFKLGSAEQFVQTERHFRKRCGSPRVSADKDGLQTVYRWHDGDVRIKLKSIPANGDFKFGIYYAPLSDRLNRQKAEELPEELYYQSGPEQPGAAQTAALLEE